jgi:hypothetical protein
MVRSAASLPRSRASKLQQRSGARQEAGKLGTGNVLREVLEGFSLIGNRSSGIIAISLAGGLQGVDALPSTPEAGFEMWLTGYSVDHRQEGQPDDSTRI